MNRFFFSVNLNKYGELRRKMESERKTFVATIVSFCVFTLIMSGVVVWLNVNLQNKINNRKALNDSIKEEVATYEVSGEYLTSTDMERLTNVSTKRIFWAKKLVALAEKTTDKIAITHFSYKNDKLSLFGITKMDKKEKEFDLIIEDFIQKLKDNEQISTDFPGIEFVRSRQDFEKDVEIIRFQIDCISRDLTLEPKKRKNRTTDPTLAGGK